MQRDKFLSPAVFIVEDLIDELLGRGNPNTDDHQPAPLMPFSFANENTERSATVWMGVGIGDDNSRRQVQNVRGNSSAPGPTAKQPPSES